MSRTLADLYPLLKEQFDADPNATSIDVFNGKGLNGPIVLRVTREMFERERMARDLATLITPIGKTH